MPISPTYPGIYIDEVPSGVRSIVGSSTSVTAFIDFFKQGPMNIPVQIFSFSEFERIFGGLDARSKASYAIWQFFLNGGQQAVVVRVASQDIDHPLAVADIGLRGVDPTSNTIQDPHIISIFASSPGSWGNFIGVQVTHVTPDIGTGPIPTTFGTFNLAVTQYSVSGGFTSPIQTENWSNLSMNSADPRYFPSVINGQSQLILAELPYDEYRYMPVTSSTTSGMFDSATWTSAIELAPTETVDVTIENLFSPSVTFSDLELKGLDLSGNPPKEDVININRLAQILQTTLRSNAMGRADLANAIVRVDRYNGKYALAVILGGSGLSSSIFFSGGTALNKFKFGTFSSSPTFIGMNNYILGTDSAAFAPNVDVIAPSITTGSDGIVPSVSDIIGTSTAPRTGMYALDIVETINILVVPRLSELDSSDFNFLYTALVDYCETRQAFFIVDPPENINTPSSVQTWVNENASTLRRKNTAIYFPRLKIGDPLSNGILKNIGASGTIAGLYAKTDTNRGVWKAPAGIEATLRGITSLTFNLTDGDIGLLNPLGINALRVLTPFGQISWGARTLVGADVLASEWKYIPVRRITLYIEQSVKRGSQFAVFEPNDEPLWASLRLAIGSFLQGLFQQGAFQGSTPQEAFFVKVDGDTTMQQDINNGIVNIAIGFAPLKPAEFVILRIQQMAGQNLS